MRWHSTNFNFPILHFSPSSSISVHSSFL
uniref:Uncharacterized protein n=1 Tax=Vitis vinifera TaxID=29760 RepID=F6HD02_VITVI